VDAPRADPTRCEPAVALAAREIKGGALFEAQIGPASVHSTALATARVATDMIRSGEIQKVKACRVSISSAISHSDL
jgi:hypothetical protein